MFKPNHITHPWAVETFDRETLVPTGLQMFVKRSDAQTHFMLSRDAKTGAEVRPSQPTDREFA